MSIVRPAAHRTSKRQTISAMDQRRNRLVSSATARRPPSDPMAAGWLGCQPRSRLAVPRWRSQRLRRGNRGNRPASDYGAESREQGLSWERAMKQAGQAGPLAALSEDCLGPAGPPGRSLHPATPSIPDGPPRPLRQPCRQPRFASTRSPRHAATRPPGSPASGSAGVGRGGEWKVPRPPWR